MELLETKYPWAVVQRLQDMIVFGYKSNPRPVEILKYVILVIKFSSKLVKWGTSICYVQIFKWNNTFVGRVGNDQSGTVGIQL